MVTSTYSNAFDDIHNSIRLGIAVESDDPNLEALVKSITDEQAVWIAAWLAGEGFHH